MWTPILGAIPSAFGIALGLSRIRAARARRRWREAEAEIVSTELDDSARREFHIEYRYVVDGREYTNDHILPGQDAVSEPDSLDLFRQYPLHRHTTVFFDPEDPTHSALDVGSDDLVLRPILFGAAGLGACALWLWAMLAGWP